MNRQSFQRTARHDRSGVILLVVLSALTFFSLLIAAYLVFSNQSRQSSFVMASRKSSLPDVDGLMNEALMTLIRGTNDPQDPFFGEDLMSDYYGRSDSHTCRVRAVAPLLAAAPSLGYNQPGIPVVMRGENGTRGFLRFPIEQFDPVTNASGRVINRDIDDILAGRVITFTQGPLENRTYRILRSIFVPQQTPAPPDPPQAEYDMVFIELKGDEFPVNTPSLAQVLEVFYPDSTTTTSPGFQIHMNGVPQNSRGIGFNGTAVAGFATAQTQDNDLIIPAGIGYNGTLPAALQPNHIRRMSDKSTVLGDFDEGYDAADYNNWFLAHRNRIDIDGNGILEPNEVKIIPSFHRPSVINYILNEQPDWTNAASADYRNLLVALRRGTFRPFPIAEGQLLPDAMPTDRSRPLDERFTGGSSEFALRAPQRFINGQDDTGPVLPTAAARLNQLMQSLIDPTTGWDVDNDGDGVADSIWMNIGLPFFATADGRLIQPLIAPMIEDLSGRLNVNAHDNNTLDWFVPSNRTDMIDNDGDGTTDEFDEQFPNGINGLESRFANFAGSRGALTAIDNERRVFQGLGYGPAEIVIPSVSLAAGANSLITTDAVNIDAGLAGLRSDRYQFGAQANQVLPLPGRNGADRLDILMTGARPALHTAAGGYGYSIDPFGRGGVAMGRSGELVSANSGSVVRVDNTGTAAIDETTNEALQDPYELDPSGRLSGDDLFAISELESILRANDFDSEFLPQRLRSRLLNLVINNPEFVNALTTISVSTDNLTNANPAIESPLAGLIDLIGTGLNQVQVRELIAPEIRLGHKLDINRPFGNGIDDPGFWGVDDDGANGVDDAAEFNGIIDEPSEVIAENRAFAVSAGSGQAVPIEFQTTSSLEAGRSNYLSDTLATTITGRQLLARHLYVLMMALTANGSDLPASGGTPFTAAQANAYKARRIAQWAVNVVDYRDPDSIMTRFAFDPNLANGWNEPPLTVSAEFVVWGVEAPEMVFSENLALHDVRLRDTDQDNGPMTTKTDATTPDPHSDQVRVPQGSLFVELLAPRSPVSGDQITKRSFPRELYNVDLATGAGELDLTRTAPSATAGGTRAPVWRIAISEPHYAGLPKANLNPGIRFGDASIGTSADTASIERLHPDEILPPPTGAANILDFERFILFQAFGDVAAIQSVITDNNIADMQANEVFFAPNTDLRSGNAINADRTLEPGQFLALAPRQVTTLGSKELPIGTFPGTTSQQRFVVSPGFGVIQYELGRDGQTAGVPAHPGGGIQVTPELGAATNYRPALPLIIGAFRPALWPATAFEDGYVGLNVSEPLPGGAYYQTPRNLGGVDEFRPYNGAVDNDGVPGVDFELTDAYLNFADPTNFPALDVPLDVGVGIIPSNGIEPELGTVEQFCTIYLQRLADPTIPFNATTNPYRTIDWMSVDLTVFSGEDRDGNIDAAPEPYAIASRQRNGFVKVRNAGGAVARTPGNVLFSNETNFSTVPTTAPTVATLPDYFAFGGQGYLNTSLSFLNTATTGNLNRADPNNAVDQRNGRSNPGFLGFSPSIGSEGATAAAVLGNDRNFPQIPYAMHPWLNRPFASELELMMVPACSQGRLFEEFTINTVVAPMDPVVAPDKAAGTVDPVAFNSPFRHLLNFFHSAQTDGNAAQFNRLFDFVHTLPRFQGEVEVFEPDRIVVPGASGDLVSDEAINQFRTLFLPPFNRLHDNRRQGRINLNTLSEFPVWAGLMKGHLNPTEFTSSGGTPATADQLAFATFLGNRRGYVPPGGAVSPVTAAGPYNYDPVSLDDRIPSQVAGAYKNSIEAGHAPVIRDGVLPNLLRRRGANSTLLRGSDILEANEPAAGPVNQVSLFVRGVTQLPNQTTGYPSPADPTPVHLDRDRNPFLRYQTLMRMPNLVSDNSQVFLIRFTMGFFELDTNTLGLGREYNEDLGLSRRYRGMFIVDRSREVGFDPGRDLNTRDVVLFERYER